MTSRSISLLSLLSMGVLVACAGARPTDLENGVFEGIPADSPEAPSDPSSPNPGNPGDPKKPGGKTCTPDVSAFDEPGNGLDEDCSGKADDESFACDTGLQLGSNDAFEAAKAIGLCKKAVGANGWGILSARYVRPDGVALAASASLGYGLLPSFGVNKPVLGGALLALSSGTARAPGQVGYQKPTDGIDRGYTHDLPAGLGTKSACPGVTAGAAHDGVALEVKLRVPSNARSFTFAHQFFTPDYKEYVCTQYNDRFVVMMTPKPAGSEDGNLVVDGEGIGLSASSAAFIRACQPGSTKGLTFACPLGVSALAGTGFENHASTGWLKTTSPVVPGSEITLRFAVWDSADGTFDSTVLVDGFTFSSTATTAPMTEPR